MDMKKESLAEILRQKSHELDEAIRLVSSLIKNVKDDVEKIKNEIHSAFNAQKKLLHVREEQLVRQIEVLSSEEKNFYHAQCAELHHLMGSLDSYLHSKEELPANNFVEIINKKIKSVKHLEKKRNLNFKFLTDATGLQSAIQNFGEISLLRAVIGFPHFEGSICLPSKIEYEDEDHLYKTVDSVNNEKNSVKFNFQKPLLENHEWLSSSNLKKNSVEAKANHTSLADALIKIDEGSMSSVQNWLREITSTEECEIGCRSEMNSHRCSWSDGSVENSVDDSIVLLSMPQSNSMCDCKDMHSTNVMNPLNCEWLSKDSRKCEKKNSFSSSCHQCICCSQTLSFETKNEMENNLWLRKMNKSETKPLLIQELKDVCHANETCKNYLECVNDEKDSPDLSRQISNSLEKKSVLWPSNVQVIRPLLTIMYGKNNWLSSNVGKSFDVNTEATEKLDEMNKLFGKKFEFPNYYLNSDLKNWLHHDCKSFVSETKEKINTSGEWTNRSKWLTDVTATEKDSNMKNKIASMFQSYFEPKDSQIWLSKSNESTTTEQQ